MEKRDARKHSSLSRAGVACFAGVYMAADRIAVCFLHAVERRAGLVLLCFAGVPAIRHFFCGSIPGFYTTHSLMSRTEIPLSVRNTLILCPNVQDNGISVRVRTNRSFLHEIRECQSASSLIRTSPSPDSVPAPPTPSVPRALPVPPAPSAPPAPVLSKPSTYPHLS